MTTLVIDIGNTSASIGYYRNGRVFKTGRCRSRFRALDEVVPLIIAKPVDAVAFPSDFSLSAGTNIPVIESNWDNNTYFERIP